MNINTMYINNISTKDNSVNHKNNSILPTYRKENYNDQVSFTSTNLKKRFVNKLFNWLFPEKQKAIATLNKTVETLSDTNRNLTADNLSLRQVNKELRLRQSEGMVNETHIITEPPRRLRSKPVPQSVEQLKKEGRGILSVRNTLLTANENLFSLVSDEYNRARTVIDTILEEHGYTYSDSLGNGSITTKQGKSARDITRQLMNEHGIERFEYCRHYPITLTSKSYPNTTLQISYKHMNFHDSKPYIYFGKFEDKNCIIDGDKMRIKDSNINLKDINPMARKKDGRYNIEGVVDIKTDNLKCEAGYDNGEQKIYSFGGKVDNQEYEFRNIPEFTQTINDVEERTYHITPDGKDIKSVTITTTREVRLPDKK